MYSKYKEYFKMEGTWISRIYTLKLYYDVVSPEKYVDSPYRIKPIHIGKVNSM